MATNQELFDKLNEIKSKIDILQYQKEENEKKNKAIMEDLSKIGINSFQELQDLIEKETKELKELRDKFSTSLEKVSAAATELENKAKGIPSK